MKRQLMLAFLGAGTVLAAADSPAGEISQQSPGAAEFGFLVAEPGALALLGLAIALLGIIWRRRK